MASLVPAHGDLLEPLDCTVSPAEEAAFTAELAKLPKVPVSDADLSTVSRFGDGALGPLTGPMDGATYHQVLDHAYIEHQGKRYAWRSSHVRTVGLREGRTACRPRRMPGHSEVAPNCRTLQMLSFAAKLSSQGVSYGQEVKSPEASWSSCVQ